MKEYKTLFICCGTGGSTLGFQEARQEYTKGIWVDSDTEQEVIVNVKH